MERQREVPLTAVKQIECTIKKEWMEKEWKFKETTSDEKIYTGRSIPPREYLHTITLNDGRTITGPLVGNRLCEAEAGQSANKPKIQDEPEPERFLLNKRNKGEPGETLKSLVYVKRIKLGKDALEDGLKNKRRNVSAKPQAAR